jgi:uncharacterized membrane protein (UPF0127 family)
MSLIWHFLLKFLFRPGNLLKLALLISLIAFSEQSSAVEISINQNRYQIELATNADQRRMGLMYREYLPFERGMLLVYSKPGDHRIWMKNMQIPLTVAWIGEDLKIIDVQQLEPCQLDPCKIYSAAGASRFVLELNAEQHDILIGDRIVGIEMLLK